MLLLNTQFGIAVGNVAAAAAVILAEPDVYIVNLRVGVHKLN